MSESVLPNHLINFSEKSLLKLPSSLYKDCKKYLSPEDIKKIQKAYSFAFYAHSVKKEKMDQTILHIQLLLQKYWLI